MSGSKPSSHFSNPVSFKGEFLKQIDLSKFTRLVEFNIFWVVPLPSFLELVPMKNWLFLFLFALILQGCSDGVDKTEDNFAQYQLKILDSIQVAYQGNLFLFDHDPKSNQYLGMDNGTEEVLLFDREGEIKSQFKLAKDGPNATTWANSIGFFDGQFTVMDAAMGLLFFSSQGEIMERIDLSPPYMFINGLRMPVHAFGNELTYVRPERGEIDWNNQAEMFENIYRSPILEVYDPSTGTIRNTMLFPPGTIYEDGNYYHWMFPTVISAGKEWLVYFRAEQTYHVYQQEGEQLVYQQTVDLEIENAVKIKGVPLANMEDYYEKSIDNIFGRIQNLYVLDSLIVIHYTKGLEEEKVKQFPRNILEERTAFLHQIKNYLAVLNREHQMLQKDILVPQGIILSGVAVENGAILGLKDQDFFGVEEDMVTFYMMELN